MNADALKIFFTQRAQAGHELGAHGRDPHQQLRRWQARPCRPFGIVFRAIARKFRGLLGQNTINALKKYLVVAREMGELFVRGPFAGDRLRIERLRGNATQGYGQKILKLGFTAMETR